MPKIVDHKKRRADLAQAAVEVIAAVGIDRVRMRDVARAAGFTAGALAHYFEDKDAILIAALRHVHASFRTRAKERVLSAPFDPVEIWLCVLPVDDERHMEWKVWLAFASRASHDPAIAAEFQQRRQQSHADTRLVLYAMKARGEFEVQLDVELAAEVLAVWIEGLGLRATLDPGGWPAERTEARVEGQLRMMGWRGSRAQGSVPRE